MPMNINGVNSYSSANALKNNPGTEFNRISSGKRINSAADDAAGLAISNRMSSQVNGFSVAIRNAGDGVSFSQVADGALTSLNDGLQRARELSLQAANGSLNAQDRKGIQAEISQILEQTNNTLEKTSFNGVKIFDSDSALSFQTGPNSGDTVEVSAANLKKTITDTGLSSISVNSQESAAAALSVIDKAMEEINSDAAEFGAVANRFESTIENLSRAQENITESRSRVSDADIAKEATNLISKQIRNQADIALQAQANSNRGNVLRLLS